MVVLAPHGEVEKALPLVRLPTHKFLSIDAVVSFELLATVLADKHMSTVLPNLVLVKRWQRLERLATLQGQTISLSFALYFCAPSAPSSSQS